MENQTSIFKFSLNPGIILGIALILLAVTLYVIGINQVDAQWTIVVNWLISAIVFYLYQKNYRDNFNSALLSLGEAVKISVSISVIAAIIFTVYNLLFVYVLEPGYLEEVLLKAEEKMVSDNPELTQQQIDMTLGFTKKLMDPMISIPLGIISKAISGLILGLITGLFVKRSNAPV